MDVDFETRLRVDDVAFGAEDAALLRAVDREGSLHAAADTLGRSYSRAHGRVRELETALGSLLERSRGGAGGGGSELTADARALLARFDRLEAALADTAEAEEVVVEGTTLSRDGELATVETPAGVLAAVLFEPANSVQVTIRADAVTLHDITDAPEPGRTNARNHLSGVVVEVDQREAVASVSVEVAGLGTLPNHIVEGAAGVRTDIGAQPSDSEEVVSTAMGGDWEFRGIRPPQATGRHPSTLE
jgi:molybdate transport system regulatory protein